MACLFQDTHLHFWGCQFNTVLGNTPEIQLYVWQIDLQMVSHWNLFNIIPSYFFVDQLIINSTSVISFQLHFPAFLSSCTSATSLFYLTSIYATINSNCISVLKWGLIFLLKIIMLNGTSLTFWMFLIFFHLSI